MRKQTGRIRNAQLSAHNCLPCEHAHKRFMCSRLFLIWKRELVLHKVSLPFALSPLTVLIGFAHLKGEATVLPGRDCHTSLDV